MVAAVGLPLLGGVIAVLAILGLPSQRFPPHAAAAATAALCLVAAAVASAVLAAGGRGAVLGGMLSIDPLAAFFVLPPAIAGLAGSWSERGGALPAIVAASLLAVLAGNTPTLLLAVAVLATLAGAAAGLAVLGAFLLAAALAVLGAASPAFAAIRAAPPDGARALLVLLALVGAVALLSAARRRPFAAAPAVELYVLLRVAMDLCGPATPELWGVPLLLLGAGLALAGAVRAARAVSFDGVLAGLSGCHGGWMAASLGVCAVARAADLLPLATLAAGGAMLHALNYAVFGGLAGMATGSAARAAASQALDRLGGLARAMPAAGVAMLVAGSSLALLPPSAGFASGWLIVQALFAAPRIGGVPLQLLLLSVVLALAVSAGVAALAVVRMGGVAFLGRPRTPRAAAAEETGRWQRPVLLGASAVCGVLGLLPGLALQLAGPAQQIVTGGGLELPADMPAAGVFAAVLVVGAALAVLAITMRVGTLPRAQAVPAWDGGFAAPPAWMPFGEPATQVDAAAFGGGVSLPGGLRVRFPRVRVEWAAAGAAGPRAGLAALFAAAVGLLLLVAAASPA